MNFQFFSAFIIKDVLLSEKQKKTRPKGLATMNLYALLSIASHTRSVF